MQVKEILLLGTVLSAACGPPPELVTLVVDDVTVIDPRSGQILPNHSVFVDAGRIVGVVPAGRGGPFVATDSVDGSGQYLIPGLMDMHIHLFGEERLASATMDLLLANGITGFRDMAADCLDPTRDGAVCPADLRDLAEGVDSGERVAPRPLALATLPVNGISQRERLPEGAPAFLAPGTAEDGRELARWVAERDLDLVKVYNTVPRQAYFALLEEANALGLEVSGHLPLGVSVTEASNAGQRTIEHARDLPVACSSYGGSYRELMARVVDGDAEVTPPSPEERLRAILEAYDPSICQEVFHVLIGNGTYLVPTHGTREMDFRAGDPGYRADARMRYVLPPLRESWDRDLDETAGASDELVALFGEFYELGLELSAMAHAAGVKLMAGTDANDTMIFPGSALHDELSRFAAAGIGGMDVLRTATSTPAEYLGLEGELGTVAVGARADLVLLGEDPIADMENTRSIEAVILGGKVHERGTLDALLKGVEATASVR